MSPTDAAMVKQARAMSEQQETPLGEVERRFSVICDQCGKTYFDHTANGLMACRDAQVEALRAENARLTERADRAESERDALARAIWPAYPPNVLWESLAHLAEAHREDSEAVDATATDDSYGQATDYRAARMRREHEAEERGFRAGWDAGYEATGWSREIIDAAYAAYRQQQAEKETP